MRIIDLLIGNKSRLDKTAVCDGADKIDYQSLVKSVKLLALQLNDAGCCKGDKIAILLDNSIEYIVSFFAISEAKAIIVPLSARMTTRLSAVSTRPCRRKSAWR